MLSLRQFPAAIALFLVSFTPAQGQTEPQLEPAHRISHFSGLPVPRFEALRASAVYGRRGPSFDHPIAWLYEHSGMPVLVIKETENWRRVRDIDGDEVWIHKRMLTRGNKVMVRGDATLRDKQGDDTQPLVRLSHGVLVDLIETDGVWSRIQVDGHRGWVRAGHLWGTQPDLAPL